MKFQIIITTCLLSLVAFSVDASQLYFFSSQNNYNIDDIFKTDVILNTQEDLINTIEIGLKFDSKSLELMSIAKGGSIITLWIQDPDVDKNGVVSFVGGIPRGFKGEGQLVSLYFKAVKSGIAQISFQDNSKILLNDGFGTSISPDFQSIDITILLQGGFTDELKKNLDTDNIPPKNFKIRLEHNSTVFDNKYFIVFSTTDDQSGVTYYEIKEGGSDWTVGKSPYLLKNQNLNGKILVKAVDGAGNERVERLVTEKEKVTRFLIILLALVLYGLVYLLIKRNKKNWENTVASY
ncbi:cohesin domain-containing protein [Patescibacteria group bacterium]